MMTMTMTTTTTTTTKTKRDHLALKSATTRYGISINSEDDLASYCRKLTT